MNGKTVHFTIQEMTRRNSTVSFWAYARLTGQDTTDVGSLGSFVRHRLTVEVNFFEVNVAQALDLSFDPLKALVEGLE